MLSFLLEVAMKVEAFEELTAMLLEVKRRHGRNPGGSLRRVLPTVEDDMMRKSSRSAATIAGRWTSDIGLEGPNRKAELRELIGDWLNGNPAPLFGQILPHVGGPLKDKLREILFENAMKFNETSDAHAPEVAHQLSGTLHLPPREFGAIVIQAGKLGVSVWKFIELLLLREARRSLEKFESVADVEDLAQVNPYPLRGTPLRYDDPTAPVGLDDWEALK
jgi:hypothetical protein